MLPARVRGQGYGVRKGDRTTRRGLWIRGRKIMRHPRDFWWIDYALNRHIWIVRRWLYDRGLRFMRPGGMRWRVPARRRSDSAPQ
jgi:hypothetical protein